MASFFGSRAGSAQPQSEREGEWSVGILETSLALGACLVVLVVAVVLDRRPYHPGKGNYIPIMIIALAAILILARHLITLISFV
jgi:hypothetical protein